MENLRPAGEICVSSLRRGDERAFAALFDHYARKVYLYSRKFGLPHQDAEGIVQEVFLKIWQRKKDLNEQLSLNAYIYKIAKSFIIKRKKRLLLERVFVQLENGAVPDVPGDEDEHRYIINDLLSWVYRIARNLPSGQREVFELKNKEHLSVDEIAVRLNVPKRRVENQIYLANRAIKSKINTEKILWLAGTGFFELLQ
ncbi:RNA polymerase sigma-70 factor, ECF subfamily [Cyclobacterium lianum]|uniref:RNA polymerase sigma-70 factor, ECF subfamily n=1 Tax=Cyclobacterium lianum TaxID=388280 RepID=A0A1M7PA41_9BACT|nr:sigma-70 family RNA polymerase sigma factor [Cyclobacterium lianum]SHN13673.1 RNA polymerase sigma-70 factor, ECF subfamily [Cyclobacterium lianum]